MPKVYIGGLPPDIDQPAILSLLEDKNLRGHQSVEIKRGGYAFVQFGEEREAERAVAVLHGLRLHGTELIVELSGEIQDIESCKIVINAVPESLSQNALEDLCSRFGSVINMERDEQGQVGVTYADQDQANLAAKGLSELDLNGSKISAMLPVRAPGGIVGPVGPAGPLSPGEGGPKGRGRGRGIDFPLRVLVSSDMVGAIIGRGGATIRNITQQSRARVDVHRKLEHSASLEKAITVYGQPENCTAACKRILEVMEEEAKNVGKPTEISLKILAHNNLIGRIIGKQGATIKKIMEDTDTKITVSSISDISSFNLERVITIKGTIPDIARAESEVSSKLRAAYETDLQAMAPQSVMFPGLHPAAMMSTVGLGTGHPAQAYNRNPGFMPAPGLQGQSRPAPPQVPTETSYLYIPNAAVGAIIGTKGSHIRNIIKFSGSTVKIASADGEEEHSTSAVGLVVSPVVAVAAVSAVAAVADVTADAADATDAADAAIPAAPVDADTPAPSGEDASPAGAAALALPSFSSPQHSEAQRRVTIVGGPEAQWKAQYLIFEKLREEGFASGVDDVRLTVEIMVPSAQVGRIIGKGGQNVREMQRLTGAVIKLPEQGTSTGEETSVHIIGPFYSTQSAQRRIRAMVAGPSGPGVVLPILPNGGPSSQPSEASPPQPQL